VLTKIAKWVSVAALFLALLSWPFPAGYRILLLGFSVCAGAMLAAQAYRIGKYFWEPGARGFRPR
jgi:hypothetical protein